MATKLNWGIVSTGWVASQFVQDLRLAGHSIRAVGSRFLSRAQAFAARFGIPRAYGNYEAMMADPCVDIIYVATPHSSHLNNVLLALEAGKHVLIEKPITINAAEARRIAEAARRSGLVVLEAMSTRFLPHMGRVRELIAAGVLGELQAIAADHCRQLSEDSAHRINDPELGGGALLDLGIYPMSLAWDLLGAPSSIHAWARFKPTGVDAEVRTLLRYPNGELASLRAASDMQGANKAAIFGSKAWIDIDSVWCTPVSFRVHRNGDGKLLETFDGRVPGRGMQFEAAEIDVVA